jgi:transglutaminase-like putative cysteine protease
MPCDQALRLTSIVLASASFVGLVLGASLPGWLIFLTASALLVALSRTGNVTAITSVVRLVTLSPTTWNVIVLSGFLGFWIDSLWISGDLLTSGIHFLLVLMIIKLFNLQHRRDYVHLFAISLVAVLAAASLTSELWYVPIFLAYMLAGVWTLLLFQLTQDAAVPSAAMRREPEPLESNNDVTPKLFWMANGLAAATFGLTLVIFFVIPRVSAGFYQKGYGENIRTSGFSNTVDLGSIGPIKRDRSVVMRVELPDRQAHEVGRFYLRGLAFDRYDGRSWANQLSHRRSLSEDSPETFTLRWSQSHKPPPNGPVLRQHIQLEPLDTPVLFAAPVAESINGRFPAIQADVTGALYLPFPSSTRIEYSAVSRSNTVAPADLQPQPAAYSESFLRHFLQMPVQSERIAELARDVSESKRTAYEKAVAIQDHLSHKYQYSLDAPLAAQAHPLEEFLFDRKTGYCEHYATAMVMMLRAIGIPARLVTGFLATEWNEYGNYYVVRQQDAHAWVEVHLPHSGWVMMDPTPADGDSAGGPLPAWHTVQSMLDSVRLRWNRFFVQYSATDQLAVVRDLQTGGASVRLRTLDSLAAFLRPLTAAFEAGIDSLTNGGLSHVVKVVAILLAGCGVVAWLVWARPWNRLRRSTGAAGDEQAIVQLYRRMLRQLERRGIHKPAAMPPLQFIRIIQAQWSTAGTAVASITDLYCRARFGRASLTNEELRRAQDQLRHLSALGGS